jgi:hypothetical protein
MPCFKTLPFSQAITGEAPLQDAVYVSSVNKIFGVSGVYVLQFNATTGAREAQVRISAPVMGDARLCYHAATGMLYASVWNVPNQAITVATRPNKDIYPIDPATMVVGTRLNLASIPFISPDYADANRMPYFGPKWIASSGNYLYVQWAVAASTSYYQWFRVNPTNLADRCTSEYNDTTTLLSEQAALSPTQIVVANPFFNTVDYGPVGWNAEAEWDTCDLTPYTPISCEYCSLTTLFYAVDGDGNFFRINDLVLQTFDQFDMNIWQAGAKTCRLRYSGLTEDIYLPSMTTDSVILWDPVTEIAQVKTGFTNPIDVVFTPSRAFAVQNSPAQSLKEIT